MAADYCSQCSDTEFCALVDELFPVGYMIDRTANGTPLYTSAAVRTVGNSVSPPPLRALAEANLDPAEAQLRISA